MHSASVRVPSSLSYGCFVLDQREGAGCDEDVLIEADGGAYRGARSNLLYLPRRLQVSGTYAELSFVVIHCRSQV